ncbi:MAG: glycosyltransferase family 4 protein [Candidatus Eiseniibacteriota bacterium]
MRVGIVTQSYYPRYGGVTEHVHHTALELRRRGHDVTIITGRFRDRRETEPATAVEHVGTNVLVPFNQAFVDLTIGFGLRRRMRRRLRAGAFDLLHIHNPNTPTLPLLAIEEARCATVGTFHSTGGRSFLQDTFREWLGRSVARLDTRIAVSRTAEASARLYYPGEYTIIPNGVDVDRFRPDVAPFETWRDEGHVNLLFVGRLDPRKGLHLLLAAMPEVCARTRGRARLLIVGNSVLRPGLEARVPAAVRDRVRFLGHVPSADLPRWYATGDIFVSPASGNESFGIVLLEAMAAGRPVVATDIPGYRSVIQQGENAEAFPPGDVASLARALVRLIEDPARRAELARRGRARAMEFAWPRVTDRIEAVYRQTLERRTAVTSAA